MALSGGIRQQLATRAAWTVPAACAVSSGVVQVPEAALATHGDALTMPPFRQGFVLSAWQAPEGCKQHQEWQWFRRGPGGARSHSSQACELAR